ncbi:MAG: multiheme c-type cytochrome [Prolixibacteraceae bacterium]
MKIQKFFKLSIFAVALMAFGAACVKEGPPGQTGAPGTNGTNGKDANTTCLTCHTTANMTAKEAQYQLSKHFFGTTSARNTKYCARCHTSEGFKEITTQNKYVVSNDIPNATRISCETCHAHTTFEFGTDPAALILTVNDPVYLNYFNNLKAQDFGKKSNICSTCHQIRGVTSIEYTDAAGKVQKFNQLPYFPLDVTKQNTTVKYQVGTSFAVHDGNQSNEFAGINGYEFSGQTYTRTWQHSSYSCTDCHMNEYDATTKTGGHSLIVNKAKCTACHGSDKLTPIQNTIKAKLTELGDALAARKVFKKTVNASTGAVSYSAEPTHDFLGTIFATTAPVDPKNPPLYSSLTAANTLNPGPTPSANGLVVYANTISMAADTDWANRLGREWKYGELGAAYNYGWVNFGTSMGVHNPKYTLQLLQTSIDWLKSN